MDFFRIACIAMGGLIVVLSVCQFFLVNTKYSKLFIGKWLRRILSEGERIDYQKAKAKPMAFSITATSA